MTYIIVCKRGLFQAKQKSSAWKTLLQALEMLDGTEGVSYVIDPKGW